MEEGKSKDFMKMGENSLNVFLLERSLGVRTYLGNISGHEEEEDISWKWAKHQGRNESQ